MAAAMLDSSHFQELDPVHFQELNLVHFLDLDSLDFQELELPKKEPELEPPKKQQKLEGPFSKEASWGFRISRSLLELTELTKRSESIWTPLEEPQYKPAVKYGLVDQYVSPPSSESKQPHAPENPSPLRRAWKWGKVK